MLEFDMRIKTTPNWLQIIATAPMAPLELAGMILAILAAIIWSWI